MVGRIKSVCSCCGVDDGAVATPPRCGPRLVSARRDCWPLFDSERKRGLGGSGTIKADFGECLQ